VRIWRFLQEEGLTVTPVVLSEGISLPRRQRAFHQTVHAEFAERVAPIQSESNELPKRDIVGKDCRRAAEGHCKSLARCSSRVQYCRKTIQYQIAIQFTPERLCQKRFTP